MQYSGAIDLENQNSYSTLLENFVNNDVLQNLINREESLDTLSCYLKLKCERIERKLDRRTDFCLNNIISNKTSTPSARTNVLYLALSIQKTNKEFIRCLKWFDGKLNVLNGDKASENMANESIKELIYIADIIMKVKKNFLEEIVAHIHPDKLKLFLLKLTEFKLNIEGSINLLFIFLNYFDEIISKEPSFMDETVHYLVLKENFDFLCIIFNKRLLQLSRSDSFQKKNEIWSLLKTHIISGNSTKKKQAIFILFMTIEFLKLNNLAIVPEVLRVQSFEHWNLYFVLLDISKEKQLHLIQPTLRLLPSVADLHIMWQICLYKILLNHSQLFVVYKAIEYLLQLKFEFDQDYQALLVDILLALNKYEYSDLSQSTFDKFEYFCIQLEENCCITLLEEFSNIDWNPAAAWCFLRSASSLFCKMQYYLIKKMLCVLKKIPHTFIKHSCIFFFLQKLLNSLTHNILEDIIQVGYILLFTDVEIDEELFYAVVEKNKVMFEGKADELKAKVHKSYVDNNEELLYICLKLSKILNISIDLNLKISYSIIGDIILLYFPNLLKPVNFRSYLLHRIECIGDRDCRFLSKFLSIFIAQHELSNVGLDYDYCMNIWHHSRHNNSQAMIAVPVISQLIDFGDYLEQFMSKRQDMTYLKYKFYESLFKGFRNSLDGIVDEKIGKLFDKFQTILKTDDEKFLYISLANLDLLTKCVPSNKILGSVFIYDECIKQICRLPNTLLRQYSVVFFSSIFHPKLFSCQEFVEDFKRWYTDFFEDHFFQCEIVMKVMLEGCRKLIILNERNMDILIPLILQGLLSGTIIQKKQRVEYGICQEIHRTIGKWSTIQNPNFIAMELKMIAVESLYLLTKTLHSENSKSISDTLIDMLLDLYKKNYKTRYFPDSKIHLEKLRIVQALLMIVQHSTKKAKVLLKEYILDSFCEESHQPSVKQLLQWLLLILSYSDFSNSFDTIIEKINATNLSHPSSVVALIPVLYHLVLSSEDIKHWSEVTQALIPWTMGANFKLRVYSQVTLKMLFKKAEEKHMENYLEKYSFLSDSISKVLEASGAAVNETLKADLVFIESFDPNLHFSVENIFITLPKMLDVPASEWENVKEFQFSDRFDMKVENDHPFPISMLSCSNKECNVEESGMNLQKKIIPWRSALEENVDNKTLGDLICVASLVDKSSNLGGLSRTCEVFSVKQLVLHNTKIKDDKEFKNLSMSSESWVNFMEVKREDLPNFLTKMKQYNYAIIGLEQTSESLKLNDFKFNKKTVLLLGNEKEGIPAPLLPLMDVCVEIPQFGQTRSLNVHVAGATFIWEYVRQHLL